MFLQPSQYILNAPLFHRFVCLTSRSLALLRMNLLPFDGWDLAMVGTLLRFCGSLPVATNSMRCAVHSPWPETKTRDEFHQAFKRTLQDLNSRFVCVTSRSLALLRMNLLPFDGWDLAMVGTLLRFCGSLPVATNSMRCAVHSPWPETKTRDEFHQAFKRTLQDLNSLTKCFLIFPTMFIIFPATER